MAVRSLVADTASARGKAQLELVESAQELIVVAHPGNELGVEVGLRQELVGCEVRDLLEQLNVAELALER